MAKFLDLTGLTSAVNKIKTWASDQFAAKSSVPTKVSDLTNDSGYQTETQVDSKINAKISTTYRYQGSVANYEALPTETMNEGTVGYVYNLEDSGANYAWAGTGKGEKGDGWDKLGDTVDLSGYVQKEEGKGLSTNDYTTPEKEKLAGLSNYTHPSYTPQTSGLYKLTVDATGHISAAEAVTKEDITNLGIPGEDTNTTYDPISEEEIAALFS